MFIAPFVGSPLPVVRHMLELAQLKQGENFFDMGAGDGRTVIMAAKDFGAKATGIELREDLVEKACTSIHELGLEERASIIRSDMFSVDIRGADVVYLYLTTSANEKVKPKLESELKTGARVVSHDYEIIGWKPLKVDNFCENPQLGYPSHTIYVYRKQ